MAALVERTGGPARAVLASFRALVVVADPRARERAVQALRALGAEHVEQAGSVDEGRVRGRALGGRGLALTDAVLPDGSGVALLAELRRTGWSRGVVLSELQDPYTVRAALAAGVRAFLVTGGDAPAAPLGGRVRAHGVDALSAREVEVLGLVAGGRSNRDIGVDLGLSALTVKSHLARIARKLGTGDRAEMVAHALRAGVID
ncbi:LuxR C-terminal-related transcriptional regulator [Vallicoccus soli]|uniref:DNA-binding response regulator n=1 Tax=Vallicoccus soli TaxID=2339232 RepID=A0A3A3YV54_9ACTN|nr:LuxR C-terminal-related transcriptional regulator [Vallicoccus soli]RJK92918.1 DNA-binding response regulator [Vallicoccus soli]